MRRRGLFTTMTLGVAALGIAGTSWAISLPFPTFGVKYADVSFADFDYSSTPVFEIEVVNGVPQVVQRFFNPHPDQTNPTGNVWGIAQLTTIHPLDDGDVEGNDFGGIHYSNGEDGKYYAAIYGGLTFDRQSGPDIYLTDTNPDPNVNSSFLRIYEMSSLQPYLDDKTAGPNVPGGGALGTFAFNMAAAGTVWLDCVFSPGTLWNYDLNSSPTDMEAFTINTLTRGASEAYLDIVGGTAAPLFERGVFPVTSVNILAQGFTADLKIISDLTSTYDTTTSTWESLWTNTSQDPITGKVVPEPGTMLLLGSGLLGVAGLGRKRSKKETAS